MDTNKLIETAEKMDHFDFGFWINSLSIDNLIRLEGHFSAIGDTTKANACESTALHKCAQESEE